MNITKNLRRDSLTAAGMCMEDWSSACVHSNDMNCCKGNDIEMESQLSN